MATLRNRRDRTVPAMISWVVYKRSAIAHGAGGNKRGLAVLKVLDYVIAEQGERSSGGKAEQITVH